MNAVINIDIRITGRKAECIINDMKVNGMDSELTGIVLKNLNDNRKRIQQAIDRFYGDLEDDGILTPEVVEAPQDQQPEAASDAPPADL